MQGFIGGGGGGGGGSTPHSESLGGYPHYIFANTLNLNLTMKLAIRVLLIVGSVIPY